MQTLLEIKFIVKTFMEIIKECNANYYLNQTKPKPKLADYFDYIYSYPPKIKLKWDVIDELKEDLFIDSNYGVLEHSFPFIDFIDDLFFTETKEEASVEKYPPAQYIKGFLEKINTSNFFLKKTKKIQTALANVPIFVLVNGQGQIVLNKPSNTFTPKTLTSFVSEKIYDSCGAFDPLVEKKSEFGLFFMHYLDAEKYFKEVARSDFEGTQTVGLSIHCISLDSAYRITREYHPGIDFRLIPNFQEVKDLLISDIGNSDMIVNDEQQQLRFRRRNINLFPYLNKLGSYLSPISSFLQRNEYFKGVPIYIVQVTDQPRNFWLEKSLNIVSILDSIYSRCIQSLDYTIGFGHNWIMQGSLQDCGNSNKFENYIFFEKSQALKFTKKLGRKVVRYNGGRTSNLEFIVRKPKIFVYNLEDFLEEWEDQLFEQADPNKKDLGTVFDAKENHFIAPTTNFEKIGDDSKFSKSSSLKLVGESLNVKFRVLKRAIGVFFSID